MSRFFPHAAYAEDQRYPHIILTTHVLTRGFQVGALAGTVLSAPIHVFRAPSLRRPFVTTMVRAAGTGGAVGTAATAAALTARMWGREPIEWADRSWRLLANAGQVALDDWTYGGVLLGAVAALLARPPAAARAVLGGAGLGSLLGAGTFVVWRAVDPRDRA